MEPTEELMDWVSATDELRDELTRRGVAWNPIDGSNIRFTEWSTHGGAFVYTARETVPCDDGMLRVETCGVPKACIIATPEQAIAATLGPGTCRIEHYDTDVLLGERYYRCTACHSEIFDNLGYRFCPYCGARVTEVDG